MDSTLTINSADFISLRSWLIQTSISRSCAWRWEKQGKLKTINIHGRKYVTRQAREEFLARAEAGEFARVAVVPKREEKK